MTTKETAKYVIMTMLSVAAILLPLTASAQDKPKIKSLTLSFRSRNPERTFGTRVRCSRLRRLPSMETLPLPEISRLWKRTI